MTTDDPQKIKARLSDIADDVRFVYQDAICCINALQAELDELQERLNLVRSVAVDFAKNNTTPRVITAEELRHGMTVARKWRGKNGERWEVTMALDSNIDAFADDLCIVLLADTPADQQEPEAEKPGYQKFYDSIGATDLLHRTPAPAPVTAETIRESEPGTTYEDYKGQVWEWNGKMLCKHTGINTLGVWTSPEYPHGPLTRSTAAPRGDYGNKELPNHNYSLILITEVEGKEEPLPVYAFRRPTAEGIWDVLGYVGDGICWLRSDQITGWKPAKVVTDE